VFILSTSNSE